MDPFDLPPELAEVERRLAARGHPQPPADFRRRVLSALRDERTEKRSAWRWAVVAAAMLLVLNLAMSLEYHRAGPRIESRAGEDLAAAARAMRQRHPDLSEQEAYQLALLVQTPPALPALWQGIDLWEGEESWDMH
ncbi:MAG TPA: hypothetical protein VMG10_26875 [Gemmataceae bacterium]|nr:hypothetical protein [Gemmataceae bacterium]